MPWLFTFEDVHFESFYCTSISENQNDDEQIVVENVPCTSAQAEIYPEFSLTTALNDQELHSNSTPQIDFISNQKNNSKGSNSNIDLEILNLDIPRLFVKFVPNSNDYRSLEWICSCKSGKRTVGCCTHVASVIYYLACGHKNEKVPMPGLKLNSLLIPICLNSEDYD
ncbi:hypothetical protein BpHYR1_053186, partial [Brachionus plicatilis]